MTGFKQVKIGVVAVLLGFSIAHTSFGDWNPQSFILQSEASNELHTTTTNMDLTDPRTEDGIYVIGISVTDEAGNPGLLSQEVHVARTPPAITQWVSDPMVLSSKGSQQLSLRYTISSSGFSSNNSSNTLPGTVILSDANDKELSRQTLDLKVGQVGTLMVDAAKLQKGMGTVKLIVSDAVGNSSETQIPIVKDGMSPEITLPLDKETIIGTQALKGVVMDPDFTNSQSLQKYKLMYKQGSFTVKSASDLSGFKEDPSVTWIPARLRQGANSGLSDNEGNVEIRALDTIGYFNPRAGDIKDGDEVTLALVVYEDGLGITAVNSRVIQVNLPSLQDTVKNSGVGEITISGLKDSYPATSLQIETQLGLLSGEGNLNVNIESSKTGQVVMNRQYPGLKSQPYIGKPTTYPYSDAFYLYKDQSTGSWTLEVKTSERKDVIISLIGLQGVLNNVKAEGLSANGNSKLLTAIGPMATLKGKCSGTGKITFDLPPSTSSDPAFSISVGFGTDITVDMDPPLYLGASLSKVGVCPAPISNLAAPVVNLKWDKHLNGGMGYVSSGLYTMRVSVEGVNGVGYSEVTRSVYVETPFDAAWGVDSSSLGTSSLAPQLKDPYSAFDTVSLFYTVSKVSLVKAEVLDKNQHVLAILEDGKRAQPTTLPYQVIWDGKIPGTYGPTLANPGSYTVKLTLSPEDGSTPKVITLPVTFADSGKKSGNLSDYIDLSRLSKPQLVNGKGITESDIRKQ